MTGTTYDTGMLIAAERGDRAAWVVHRRVLERHRAPVVPAPVLAQTWRGGPQQLLSRLLAGCRIESLDEAGARSAGRTCAAASTRDIVDASVVASAASRGDSVVTADGNDLKLIASALGAGLAAVIEI